MSETTCQDEGRWTLGPVLVLVGLLTLYFVQDIPKGSLGENQDPGPRLFPMALSGLLIVGGLWELARAYGLRRRRTGETQSGSWRARMEGLWRAPGNRDALLLVFALALYVPAIPWLGFSLSSLLFSTGSMVRLGVGWRAAVVVSLVLVVVVHVLFVRLFRVQLPAGVLGIPW